MRLTFSYLNSVVYLIAGLQPLQTMSTDRAPRSEDGPAERAPSPELDPGLELPSRRRTPLPKLQIAILLYLQLAEPITSTVIYPFVNQLIRDIGVTGGDEHKVGYFAGFIVREQSHIHKCYATPYCER